MNERERNQWVALLISEIQDLEESLDNDYHLNSDEDEDTLLLQPWTYY